LALIYESEEKNDKAETHFLGVLKSCYEDFGWNQKQTAWYCKNVESFYFKLGHDGQAGKMHGEALKARIVLFGESHFKSV
tara:strand:- start:3010 stop:3249 length:240 start_codon:yes stop_codon:yes gene_type:complete